MHNMKAQFVLLATLFYLQNISGQNMAGLRTGVLWNTIHDCMDDVDPGQGAAPGVYGFMGWQLKTGRLFFQVDMGVSQRNSRETSKGTSFIYFKKYRFKQIEWAFIGKYDLLPKIKPRIMLNLGLMFGFAFAGREYIQGGSVGPTSVDEYRKIVFSQVQLKRLQVGPMLGFDVAWPFWKGEIISDIRYAYYRENEVLHCDRMHERRLCLSLGYRWLLG